MYKSTSELIKNELSNSVIKPLYNIFDDAFIVYNDLLDNNKEIFKGQYTSEIKSRLINFIIKRYFDDDMVPKNFPFEVKAVRMAYGQKRLELRRKNIILTLGKAQTTNTLPSYAEYKSIYAKGNSMIANQLMINIDGGEEKYIDSPHYGIITYNINENKLQFLNIIMPDSNYKYVLDSIPITARLKIVENDNSSTEEDEDRFFRRESIKKEILDNDIHDHVERGNQS
ncbi:hypothetical protein OXPF_05830 [Oxobacter pfennigii]|uniref:Uncharacterized protein n=1 Tax=Oxobacter pfennigii TaxID=36849 RepID=A0A0P8YF94_9CLOT|nr:hypothetical protein [Oxobacter pfennigii]KPU45794.1 hypothetical protein OXPF_05830 [Oxobacter pfennigii]